MGVGITAYELNMLQVNQRHSRLFEITPIVGGV